MSDTPSAALRAAVEASKVSLMVLCALEKANDWHPNMSKDIAFAIEASRAALAMCRAALEEGGEATMEPDDEAVCAECGKTWGDHHDDLCPVLPRRFRAASPVAADTQGDAKTHPQNIAARTLMDPQALREVKALYDELLFAVARKFPDETRHQTALRYIRRAEEAACEPGRAAMSPTTNKGSQE